MGDGDPPRVLLEGRPGVGKSTRMRRLIGLLRDGGVPLGGLVTDEIRARGRRQGFAVETVRGERGVLAHVELPGPPRVGRYGVDLPAFERIALPALVVPEPGGVVVVDELGRMELASAAFRDAVSALLDQEVPLVATVQLHRHRFTDAATVARRRRARRRGPLLRMDPLCRVVAGQRPCCVSGGVRSGPAVGGRVCPLHARILEVMAGSPLTVPPEWQTRAGAGAAARKWSWPYRPSALGMPRADGRPLPRPLSKGLPERQLQPVSQLRSAIRVAAKLLASTVGAAGGGL